MALIAPEPQGYGLLKSCFDHWLHHSGQPLIPRNAFAGWRENTFTSLRHGVPPTSHSSGTACCDAGRWHSPL